MYALPKILTIAGSDSGGGAGIQADLKTIAMHRCYGMSVITALTAQNTLGVSSFVVSTKSSVREQLQAVLKDLFPNACKTGMLANSEVIEIVTDMLQKYAVPNLVVDPVMVSKSGARLLEPQAVVQMREELFPLATLITPNLEEAGDLLNSHLETVSEMVDAARELSHGKYAVLIKGGHLPADQPLTDVLWDGKTIHRFPSERLSAIHTHGTGCTLSAAIASNLGKGMALVEAVQAARQYLEVALQRAWPLGAGIGPVHHLHPLDPPDRDPMTTTPRR